MARKKVGAANEQHFVVARECDVPMASKKGYFPCDHKCETCLACIEKLDNGDRQHFRFKRGCGGDY